MCILHEVLRLKLMQLWMYQLVTGRSNTSTSAVRMIKHHVVNSICTIHPKRKKQLPSQDDNNHPHCNACPSYRPLPDLP